MAAHAARVFGTEQGKGGGKKTQKNHWQQNIHQFFRTRILHCVGIKTHGGIILIRWKLFFIPFFFFSSLRHRYLLLLLFFVHTARATLLMHYSCVAKLRRNTINVVIFCFIRIVTGWPPDRNLGTPEHVMASELTSGKNDNNKIQ